MCITGQIDDPETPGVWWRDDGDWCRYESTHADVIKEGVRNGQTWVTLELGETYTVDLRIMQQKNPRTGFMRPVLIVDGTGATGWPSEVQDGQSLSADKLSPVTIRICQRASRSKKWTRVSDMMARFLLRVAKSGAPSCCLDEGDGNFSMVDFQTMTKTDTLTEGTDQLRVAFPLDGEGIAAAIAGADHAQKKLVLHDLVRSLCKPDEIERFVNGSRDSKWKLVAQRPNPYLQYESALYQRFLDSLVLHMPDLAGMVSGEKLRKRKRADLNSPIAYVFHGTYLRNFESILRGGMDPEKRKFDYDYFSLEPEYSLDWCTDTTRSLTGQEDEGDLLVFLVLKLPPGFVCWDGEESFVQMEKVEYELPIAVATLRKVRARV